MSEEASKKTRKPFGKAGLPAGRKLQLHGREFSLFLLRVTAGLILTVHGGIKLANPEQTAQSFAGSGIPNAELAVYLAVAGELLGGLGLLFGFLTRIAAIGPFLTMCAAIGFVHLGNGLLASNQGWEYPLTLAMVSLYFVFQGPGVWSVDGLIAKMKERSANSIQRTSSKHQSLQDERPRSGSGEQLALRM